MGLRDYSCGVTARQGTVTGNSAGGRTLQHIVFRDDLLRRRATGEWVAVRD